MTSAICTLFEGHYHLGAAALINSLHASGFRGRFICGYRGELPPWARASRVESGSITVQDLGGGFEIWFVPTAAKVHFTNYKPTFMLEMWNGPAGDADTFFYLDPDIVVKCPWDMLQRWATGGIALCEDVNNYLPPRHPMRLAWRDWLAEQRVPLVSSELDRYYSAGFVGVPHASRDFLTLWARMIERVGASLGTLANLKEGHATSLFHTPDQDALNIALMASSTVVNGTGPEAMDFAHGGHILSHAIGSRKPWRGGFVRDALRGYPPSTACKAFIEHVSSPIQVFTPAEKRRLVSSLQMAALIGRFYRRA
ncbi:hypothetical protein DB347_13750 [Opitutaceae bacterium EW11]|nr:hypothetical protein DB347_13750 [Opitutaceae bacterium EW11]